MVNREELSRRVRKVINDCRGSINAFQFVEAISEEFNLNIKGWRLTSADSGARDGVSVTTEEGAPIFDISSSYYDKLDRVYVYYSVLENEIKRNTSTKVFKSISVDTDGTKKRVQIDDITSAVMTKSAVGITQLDNDVKHCVIITKEELLALAKLYTEGE